VLLASVLLALLTAVAAPLVGNGDFRHPDVGFLLGAGLPPQAVIGLLAGQTPARGRLASALIPEALVIQPWLLVIVFSLWWMGRFHA
jgi:hypothetical protein